MARLWRVRDRATFAALRRDGARRRVGPLSVVRLDPERGGSPRPAVAFAIGRAAGSAVDRNRIRRRLRAVLGEVDLRPGTYLLSAGPSIATLSHQELRALVVQGVA
jgi:ribonuclease P protein component